MLDSWTVIFNPRASTGKSKLDAAGLKKLLADSGIALTAFHETEFSGHAIELATQVVEAGSRRLLCVGGDGTLNEVANGILRQSTVPSDEVVLGLLPQGTGNDWARSLHIPRKPTAALKLLSLGQTVVQDVGHVRYFEGSEPKERFFINVAGVGYDAAVCAAANARKAEGKSGFFGYVSTLLGCLNQFQDFAANWFGAGQALDRGQLFSGAIGIHRYNGGGMMPCPDAQFDDGLLDMTLIRKISKIAIIRNVPRLFTGRFVKHPSVDQYRSDELKIEAGAEMPLEVDGEVLGHGPCTFTCLPQRLRVVGDLTQIQPSRE